MTTFTTTPTPFVDVDVDVDVAAPRAWPAVHRYGPAGPFLRTTRSARAVLADIVAAVIHSSADRAEALASGLLADGRRVTHYGH